LWAGIGSSGIDQEQGQAACDGEPECSRNYLGSRYHRDDDKRGRHSYEHAAGMSRLYFIRPENLLPRGAHPRCSIAAWLCEARRELCSSRASPQGDGYTKNSQRRQPGAAALRAENGYHRSSSGMTRVPVVAGIGSYYNHLANVAGVAGTRLRRRAGRDNRHKLRYAWRRPGGTTRVARPSASANRSGCRRVSPALESRRGGAQRQAVHL